MLVRWDGRFLTLHGDATLTHEVGTSYLDANASWTDYVDGNATITATGTVDPITLGTYLLSYDYSDSSGNVASTVTRSVTVVDSTAPVITLHGDATLTHEAGTSYVDANATWSDFVDGTGIVTSTGTVDITTLGTYVLSYDYTCLLYTSDAADE